MKIRRCFRLAAGIAVIGLLATPRLDAQSCQTVVPGGSYATLHWDLAGSPYCVQGHVQVLDLSIDAGVEVFVESGFEIRVTRTLTALGTSAAPIRFTSRDPAQRWLGLVLDHTRGSRLVECEIRRASASGLKILEATPQVDGCRFLDNQTAGSGGGVYLQLGSGGAVTLTNCGVRDNVAWMDGGGLRADLTNGSRLELFRCVVSENVCNPRGRRLTRNAVGGGLDVRGDLLMVECDVSRNESSGMDWSGSWCVTPLARAGGAYLEGGSATLEGCVFRENIVFGSENSSGGCEQVTCRGGAVFFDAPTGTLDVKACLFVGNHLWPIGSTVCTQGGGLYVARGIASIDHCTVARNTPVKETNGGSSCGATDETGLAAGSATVSVTSSILWGDSNPSTPVGTEISGAVSVAYSCVEGGVSGAGNISRDPAFAGVGSTPADVLLSAGSPAIDHGLTFGGNDGCRPPAKGTAAPDMGGFGGPLACRLGWALVPGLSMSGLFTRSDESAPSCESVLSYTIYATPAHAGRTAWVILSCTGTTGFSLFGTAIPLTLDAGTLLSLNSPAQFSALINADGVANTASWKVPGTFPAGRTLYAVGVVLDFGNVPPLSNLIQAVSELESRTSY